MFWFRKRVGFVQNERDENDVLVTNQSYTRRFVIGDFNMNFSGEMKGASIRFHQHLKKVEREVVVA